MSGTRAISTTSRRELSLSSPPPLQGRAPKEIHDILAETLDCFLPGRAKDLSAPLYDRDIWAGYVARMGDTRGAYWVLVRRPEGKRPLGRPRRRWENINMHLHEVG